MCGNHSKSKWCIRTDIIYSLFLYAQNDVTLRTTNNFRNGIWTELVATVNQLKNIMVNLQEEKCAQEKFYRKINMSEHEKYLWNFGEMGMSHIIIIKK